MHLSVSAGDSDFSENLGENSSRPDSPIHLWMSDEQLNVDWNFAKREAAPTPLGLDSTLDKFAE